MTTLLKNKKIVVTGGAGFIGSNIVEKLLLLGADVVVIDNLSTGRKKNIEHLMDKIKFIEKSIVDMNAVREAVNGADYVLHQAAIPSVPRSIEDPMNTHNSNVTGTLNVFLAAKDAGVKRVVYACSSSTYGNPEIIPVNETVKLNPLSPYAVHKATKELYGRVFSDLYGLETIGLKYFNVFGPNQDPDSKYSAVIPLFIKAILAGERPTIFGDGETTRDFTYVDNIVNANILALTANGVSGEIINIAAGNPYSLNDLVATINRTIGSDVKLKYGPARAGEVRHSHADISKAKKTLDYSVQVDFKEGIKRTIEHFKEK